MKRLINTWPYAAATLVLLALVALFPSGLLCSTGWAGCGTEAGKGFALLALAVGAPVGLFAIGAALGFRRGFDWVSVAVCAVLIAIALAGLFRLDLDIGQEWFWSSLGADLFPLAGYVAVLCLGVLAGKGVRTLTRRTVAVPE